MCMDLSKTKEKAVALLTKALGSTKVAQKVERAVWNWAIQHCIEHRHALWDHDAHTWMVFWEDPHARHMYRTKVVNTYQCLMRHAEVRGQVLSKKLTVKTLVFGKPWALVPQLWESAFEAAAHRQLRSEVLTETSFDGLLQCSRCKSKKVTYCLLQTRAADEGTTVFAYCTNCSKRWKTV